MAEGFRRKQLSEQSRIWLLPLLVLSCLAVLLFAGTMYVDFLGAPGRRLSDLLFNPQADNAEGALGSITQVIAGVLGIAITVVSIVVQLAATRYSSRITEYFVKDRLNVAVMGFFVVTGTYCMWVSFSFADGFYPRFATLVTLGLASLALLILLPYFAYVFHFLNPEKVVARLQQSVIELVEQMAAQEKLTPEQVLGYQREFIRKVEDIADIGLNSVQQQDKVIAVSAVNSLRDVLGGYLDAKPRLPDHWFNFTAISFKDPDFLSFSPDVVEDIIGQRSWAELKIFRQLQTIYLNSLNRMRDINYLVAIDTREIGIHAMRVGELEVLNLVIKFYNTFMRATLNGRDIRTAYNLLYQYRQLAEAVMMRDRMDVVLRIGFYFKYYGQLANGMGIGFILETAAYDFCAMCELAHELDVDPQDRLLGMFLELDQTPEKAEQETSLRGVRKAQLKLATYYLQQKEETRAYKIYEDMKHEQPERMLSIMEELLAVPSKDFWEMTDRGANLDYFPEERKICLPMLYSWFPWFHLGEPRHPPAPAAIQK